ncbi:hypothetical protein [Cerasicoccus fimbriatus]|uniref:hypothetical protein n=1 Tax=Cerasicoccus fimbriatus TaxID=3014554 RepID=UPI0022B2BA4D|nr:hypothetical protein [Cerasicoccus sp. TK19100]
MWGLAYTVATCLLDILTELRFFFKYRLREYPIDVLCFLQYHATAVDQWVKSRGVARRVKQEERRHKLSQIMSLFDY